MERPKMIKIKVLKNKETEARVVLWIDGEFQTIHEAKAVGGEDCCMIKAIDLQKQLPMAKIEVERGIGVGCIFPNQNMSWI